MIILLIECWLKVKLSMDEHKIILAKEWFDAALSDYQYAEVGLRENQIYPQSVEPPRIHELPKLLNECIKIKEDLEDLRDACELLTGFYIESRYPPDMPQYSKEEIVEAFHNAQIVKEKIEKAVQNSPHG